MMVLMMRSRVCSLGGNASSGRRTMRNRATVSRAATKIGEGTACSVCTCKWRSECVAVGLFTLDPSLACLIAFLARCSADHRFDQRVVDFKSLGEMVRNMRGQHAGQQHCAKRLVPLP